MSHCRVNADHWSGSHPAEMQGGSNLTFCVAKGAGVEWTVLSWIWRTAVKPAEMPQPGPGTPNHIPLLAIVTLAFCKPNLGLILF